MTATDDRELSALDLAHNLVGAIVRAARVIERDELGAYLDRTGERAFAGAQLAGQLALVSIADDLHTLIEIVTGRGLPDDPDDATREHMRRWADGDDTHQGET